MTLPEPMALDSSGMGGRRQPRTQSGGQCDLTHSLPTTTLRPQMTAEALDTLANHSLVSRGGLCGIPLVCHNYPSRSFRTLTQSNVLVYAFVVIPVSICRLGVMAGWEPPFWLFVLAGVCFASSGKRQRNDVSGDALLTISQGSRIASYLFSLDTL